MIETDSYIDTNELCHVRPGEYSENGVLFSAYINIFTDLTLTPQRIQKFTDEGEVWFDPNPDDINRPDCHFSHDNMTGLYYHATRDTVQNLPTIRWNRRFWLHPRDILFYSIVKKKGSLNFLIPLLIPFLVVSCLRADKHTSGKLLWFLRGIILLDKCRNFIIINMVLYFLGDKMNDILHTYFKDENHPIHVRRLRE